MPIKTFLKHIAITYIYSDAPLTCSQKGPTLLAPPVIDLYHDPTYCILQEMVGKVVGGHGSSILVHPIHVLGGNSRATREATVSSNISPITAAVAATKPYSACDRGLTFSISAHLEFRVPPHISVLRNPKNFQTSHLSNSVHWPRLSLRIFRKRRLAPLFWLPELSS